MTWLEGWKKDEIRSRHWPHHVLSGFSHRGVVDICLLHTTEGGSYAGARSTYVARSGYRSGVHPHGTVDPWAELRWQHISLGKASYSLKRGDSRGIIQLEVIGEAATSHTWPGPVLRYIGECIGQIVEVIPTIPLEAPYSFLGAGDGTLARPWPDGKARISPTEWSAGVEGIIGHQHPPYDDHWDPGRIDVDTILDYAHIYLTHKDADMPYMVAMPDRAHAS